MKWKTPHIGRRAIIVLGLAIIPIVAGPVYNAAAELLSLQTRAPEELISPDKVVRELSKLALKVLQDILKRYGG